MRTVIFDLDGTLIDSDPDILAALNRTLAAANLGPLSQAEVKTMIGDGARALVQRGFAARGGLSDERALKAFLADYKENSVVGTTPYPGIVAALERLTQAGHRLGVCTNKPEGSALDILAALGLERFFTVVTGGDSTPYKKPDPRHLAACLAALGGGPAVMIGDHENDILAAAGLKIPSIFVTWGYGKASGDYTAHDAAELVDLVARLG